MGHGRRKAAAEVLPPFLLHFFPRLAGALLCHGCVRVCQARSRLDRRPTQRASAGTQHAHVRILLGTPFDVCAQGTRSTHRAAQQAAHAGTRLHYSAARRLLPAASRRRRTCQLYAAVALDIERIPPRIRIVPRPLVVCLVRGVAVAVDLRDQARRERRHGGLARNEADALPAPRRGGPSGKLPGPLGALIPADDRLPAQYRVPAALFCARQLRGVSGSRRGGEPSAVARHPAATRPGRCNPPGPNLTPRGARPPLKPSVSRPGDVSRCARRGNADLSRETYRQKAPMCVSLSIIGHKIGS